MKKSKQILAALLAAALIAGVPTTALACEPTDARTSECCQLYGSTLSILTHKDARNTANTTPMEPPAFNRSVASSLNTIKDENTLSSTKVDAMSMRFSPHVQTPTIALYSGDDLLAQNMRAPKRQCSPTEIYADTESMR